MYRTRSLSAVSLRIAFVIALSVGMARSLRKKRFPGGMLMPCLPSGCQIQLPLIPGPAPARNEVARAVAQNAMKINRFMDCFLSSGSGCRAGIAV